MHLSTMMVPTMLVIPENALGQPVTLASRLRTVSSSSLGRENSKITSFVSVAHSGAMQWLKFGAY